MKADHAAKQKLQKKTKEKKRKEKVKKQRQSKRKKEEDSVIWSKHYFRLFDVSEEITKHYIEWKVMLETIERVRVLYALPKNMYNNCYDSLGSILISFQ